MTVTLLTGYAPSVYARRAEFVAAYTPATVTAIDLSTPSVSLPERWAVAQWARLSTRLVAVTLDEQTMPRHLVWLLGLLDLLARVPEAPTVVIACAGSAPFPLRSRAEQCAHFPLPRYPELVASERATGLPVPQAAANAAQIVRSGRAQDAPVVRDRDTVRLLFEGISARDVPFIAAASAAFEPSTVLELRATLARLGELALLAQIETLTHTPVGAALFAAGALLDRATGRKDRL